MEFINALAGWGIPLGLLILAVVIIVLSLVIEAIGKIIKVNMPLFSLLIKPIKNHLSKKKHQEQLLENIQTTLAQLNNKPEEVKSNTNCSENEELKNFIIDLKNHYTEENIAVRDKWMLDVNTTMHWCKEKAKEYDASVQELKQLAEIVKKQSDNFDKQQAALELNNEMTSELYKQTTRTEILNFAHSIINAKEADKPLLISEEQFNKINKSFEAYEKFLATYGGTNGQVDNAMIVIRQAERGEIPNIKHFRG